MALLTSPTASNRPSKLKDTQNTALVFWRILALPDDTSGSTCGEPIDLAAKVLRRKEDARRLYDSDVLDAVGESLYEGK